MFTKRDKKQVNGILEKAQLKVQEFREDSEELQYLWQSIIHLQVIVDRIEVEGE